MTKPEGQSSRCKMLLLGDPETPVRKRVGGMRASQILEKKGIGLGVWWGGCWFVFFGFVFV